MCMKSQAGRLQMWLADWCLHFRNRLDCRLLLHAWVAPCERPVVCFSFSCVGILWWITQVKWDRVDRNLRWLCIYPFKQEKCGKQHWHFRPEKDRKTKHRNAIRYSARLAGSPLTPLQWTTPCCHFTWRVIMSYITVYYWYLQLWCWSCVNGGQCIHNSWRSCRKQMMLSACHADASNLPLC